MNKFPSIHELYEASVQDVDNEIKFGCRVYKKHFKQNPQIIREDFCGTAKLASKWVEINKNNRALAIDVHKPTIDYAIKHNIQTLAKKQQKNINILCDDVLITSVCKVDMIYALNFSFCIFKERLKLLSYFKNVRKGLKKEGVFLLDIYGGTESITSKCDEAREITGFVSNSGFTVPDFEYIWDQATYNAINHHTTCHIHFNIPGIKRYSRAFTYDWRLWTIPEIQEIMDEAGFKKSEVYLHDFNDHGESDEKYCLRKNYPNVEGWIAYIAGINS